MTPTTSRWCAALGLVAALGLAACGSDDDNRAVAALKSQILANNAMTGSSTISDEQADCIADGAVEQLGVDTLQDYAILDDDLEVYKKLDAVALEPKDADKLAGVFVTCAKVEEIFEVPLAFLMDGMNHQRRSIEAPGVPRRTFYTMPYDRFFIWGATAGMLRNLFRFLRA